MIVDRRDAWAGQGWTGCGTKVSNTWWLAKGEKKKRPQCTWSLFQPAKRNDHSQLSRSRCLS